LAAMSHSRTAVLNEPLALFTNQGLGPAPV
jgi:hypothetical protein